jgi:hypothetical protein
VNRRRRKEGDLTEHGSGGLRPEGVTDEPAERLQKRRPDSHALGFKMLFEILPPDVRRQQVVERGDEGDARVCGCRHEHKEYIAEHGGDMPEITSWQWETMVAAGVRSTEADNV